VSESYNEKVLELNETQTELYEEREIIETVSKASLFDANLKKDEKCQDKEKQAACLNDSTSSTFSNSSYETALCLNQKIEQVCEPVNRSNETAYTIQDGKCGLIIFLCFA
jgi:hypothetical protein